MESLAAFSWPNPVAVGIPNDSGSLQTEQAWSAAVSSNYFDVLRVRPQLGRTFLPEEDAAPGKAPVVVISDQLWRTHFHADPGVLGRTVQINSHPFVVLIVTSIANYAGIWSWKLKSSRKPGCHGRRPCTLHSAPSATCFR